ncbi:hypothetical protein GCM10027614_73230 [Micromonospora vulcania]
MEMLPVALTCPLWWVARWATRMLTSLAVVAALALGAGASPATATASSVPAAVPPAFAAEQLAPSSWSVRADAAAHAVRVDAAAQTVWADAATYTVRVAVDSVAEGSAPRGRPTRSRRRPAARARSPSTRPA